MGGLTMEYIEREALIDEINIAPVSMSICMNVDECKGRIYERERLMRIINAIPAADVVSRDCYDRLLSENDALRKERPVVRCGECAYRKRAWVNKKGFLICPASGMDITDNDYCSYGARMGGDGE